VVSTGKCPEEKVAKTAILSQGVPERSVDKGTTKTECRSLSVQPRMKADKKKEVESRESISPQPKKQKKRKANRHHFSTGESAPSRGKWWGYTKNCPYTAFLGIGKVRKHTKTEAQPIYLIEIAVAPLLLGRY